MQKTENVYMQDNNRRMPEITDDLFFVIDEKLNSVELTDKGHEVLSNYFKEDGFFVLPDIGAEVAELEKSTLSPEEKAAKRDEVINDYAVKSERVHTVNQLLKAFAMFEKDIEYVVMDNKVKIVDEQTGRILEGRRYPTDSTRPSRPRSTSRSRPPRRPLQPSPSRTTSACITKLAGMTGTAETEASEFWSIYKLDVVVIPTNRPVIRDDRQDLIYKTKREKYNAVIEEIVRLVGEGRPVLVGTTSVEISEPAEPNAQTARNQAQRPQCQAARPRSTGRRRSRTLGTGDHRNEHGRSWYRHRSRPRSRPQAVWPSSVPSVTKADA